jgi:hypothetical protein
VTVYVGRLAAALLALRVPYDAIMKVTHLELEQLLQIGRDGFCPLELETATPVTLVAANGGPVCFLEALDRFWTVAYDAFDECPALAQKAVNLAIANAPDFTIEPIGPSTLKAGHILACAFPRMFFLVPTTSLNAQARQYVKDLAPVAGPAYLQHVTVEKRVFAGIKWGGSHSSSRSGAFALHESIHLPQLELYVVFDPEPGVAVAQFGAKPDPKTALPEAEAEAPAAAVPAPAPANDEDDNDDGLDLTEEPVEDNRVKGADWYRTAAPNQIVTTSRGFWGAGTFLRNSYGVDPMFDWQALHAMIAAFAGDSEIVASVALLLGAGRFGLGAPPDAISMAQVINSSPSPNKWRPTSERAVQIVTRRIARIALPVFVDQVPTRAERNLGREMLRRRRIVAEWLFKHATPEQIQAWCELLPSLDACPKKGVSDRDAAMTVGAAFYAVTLAESRAGEHRLETWFRDTPGLDSLDHNQIRRYLDELASLKVLKA